MEDTILGMVVILFNIATGIMIFVGAPLLKNLLKGERVSPFVVYIYLMMFPRCMITGFYYLSSAIYNQNNSFYKFSTNLDSYGKYSSEFEEGYDARAAVAFVPINILGGFFSLYFVLVAMFKTKHYNSRKLKFILGFLIFIVLATLVPAFMDPTDALANRIDNVRPLFFLLGELPLFELLLMWTPMVFMYHMVKQKSLSDFYIRFIFGFALVCAVNLVIGLTVDIIQIFSAGVGAFGVIISLIFYIVMRATYGNTECEELPTIIKGVTRQEFPTIINGVTRHEVVQLVNGDQISYAFVIPSNEKIPLPDKDTVCPEYYIQHPQVVKLINGNNISYATIIPQIDAMNIKKKNLRTFELPPAQTSNSKSDICIDVSPKQY
ncbi:hypothetical protein CYY_008225 [Polysphondylium violaceum]|uniref:Uncharacterized protein n=1 Tax=Polysphondylium violaceum TaxID=133409 RepID=A0A8J4PNQ1_9MYCE|nr:hypothetical protein CYY_008225 [Polysphondylium violaceum]